ncbi:hypothetical protein OVA03_07900 [Asticcacaulis sp. SL142]|uniref:hypothetical protein n=1 Tax=Asticcacaulis sp. SL142 TaxID=2995155 RepID=UPI00226CEE4B|nr:hypothetical protein [Asticcacaulis sp. SL142]WAC49809.1 hypothetical protein OVA03_07900 [Asticcacaulis sp. SL142]
MAVFRIVNNKIFNDANTAGQFRALEALDTTPLAAFTQIGFGLPLTIELRHVYTGKYPKAGLFDKAKDVAVVSGLKDYSIFAATSRALNFLAPNIASRSHLNMPSPFNDGTPVIAYSPAVVSDSLVLGIEFAVDNFPGALLAQLGSALQKVGEIPLMLPNAGLLMGAGELIKLTAGLGDALFDGKSEFSITESINFDRPGTSTAVAEFRILSRDPSLSAGFEYDERLGIVESGSKKPYNGDEPYAVISLDGKPRPNLANFAPTVASAAIIKRFFNMQEGGTATIEAVVDGLKLASEMAYRQKADDVQKKLDALPATDTAGRAALTSQRDALIKNITNALLVPAKEGAGNGQ